MVKPYSNIYILQEDAELYHAEHLHCYDRSQTVSAPRCYRRTSSDLKQDLLGFRVRINSPIKMYVFINLYQRMHYILTKILYKYQSFI